MLYQKVKEATAFIQKSSSEVPSVGIVLGTGLKDLVVDIQITAEIPYQDIPHFPVPTVETHEAKLVLGKIKGLSVVALKGRLHYYEGYDLEEVTFGIRVLALLGIRYLIMTNITGSVNPEYNVGELVMVRDHINLQSENPLRGINDERLGPRFPSMLHAYDPELRKIARRVADTLDLQLHDAVYCCMNGPSLETPAEYRFLNLIGADVVGMSTVPEVIVARQHEVKTLVLSFISNKCMPIAQIKEETIESILAQVKVGAPTMKDLLKGIISKL